jgi:hypothetical protein
VETRHVGIMMRQISARGPGAIAIALVLTLIALPLILLVVAGVTVFGLVWIVLRTVIGAAAALVGAPLRLLRREPDDGRRNVRVIDRADGV